MRTGQNPNKESEDRLVHKRHRVIVPVHIPSESDYFQAAFDVFEASIQSLLATCGAETRVTIVNNASVDRVDQYCRRLLEQGALDRYVVNQENRGKAEAVLAAARGSWEEFITVADADILYLDGWLEAVARAFERIPRLGVMGLLTSPASTYRATSTVLLDAASRMSLRIGRVVDEETIREFTYSTGLVGTPAEKEMLESPQFYVVVDGERYLLGSNHAVATYRRQIFFERIDDKVSHPFRRKSKLIKHHFDIPSDRMGYWRLSFVRPFAYHMGNSVDERALALISQRRGPPPADVTFPAGPGASSPWRHFPYGLRSRFTFAFLRLALRFSRRQ